MNAPPAQTGWNGLRMGSCINERMSTMIEAMPASQTDAEFQEELRRRRAEIRARLALLMGSGEEGCAPSACASCSSSCASAPRLDPLVSESYEAC